jgi:hypothetical protein
VSNSKLPKKFIDKCKAVTAKRPKTVIDHILKHGFITTEELNDKYGYNHPPRAARDVREQGIPLETFRVESSDGRKIGAYRFGDPKKARFSKLSGRTAFSKELREKLLKRDGARCAIYLEEFSERDLQIDHRVPFEVAGDNADSMNNPKDYMLLSGSANRAKSWSCEHCANWLDLKDVSICKKCYWAYPDSYVHVAMRQTRRADILWSGEKEVNVYDRLKVRTQELQKNLPAFIKELVEKHLEE